jgi:hypothetical protein
MTDRPAGREASPRDPGTRAARGQAAVPRPPPRVIDGRPQDRHRWAVAALAVPLLFCALVALGVYLMFHRNMAFFKPAPSGAAGPAQPRPVLAPVRFSRRHAPARCANPACGSPPCPGSHGSAPTCAPPVAFHPPARGGAPGQYYEMHDS